MINPQLALAIKAAVGQTQPVAPPPGWLQLAQAAVNPRTYQAMGDNRSNQAFNQFAQAINAPAPQPTPRINGGDALGLAIGAALGKLLFHSTDNDLAQFGQGFMGMREQVAGRKDEANMRRYQNEQDLAKLKYQHEMGQANDAQEFAKSLMGLKAKAYQDQTDFNQAKQLKQMDVDAKTAAATEKTRVDVFKAMWRDASEEGRRQLALQWSTDPGFAKAVSELNAQGRETVSKTNEREKMLPGKLEGQSLKNEAQWVINQTLDEKTRAQIAKLQADTSFTNKKNAKYDEYLDAIKGRLAIQEQMARVNTGNINFDNEVKSYETRYGPERDSLNDQMKAASARMREIDKERAKPDLDEETQQALNSEYLRLSQQRDKARQRLKQIADGSPVFAPAQGDGWGQGLPSGLKPLPAVKGAAGDWGKGAAPAKKEVKPMGVGATVPKGTTVPKKDTPKKDPQAEALKRAKGRFGK